MESSNLLVFAFIILALLIFFGTLYWNYRRSTYILQNWARENGYRIIKANMRYLFTGPFFWTTSKGQTVFRVEVEDAYGMRRNGWVRCGSWLWGLFTDKAEARWDS